MTEVRTSSESNYAMPPCVRFSNPYVFWGRASYPEYPVCEIPDNAVIPHTSEANKPRNGITQRLPVSYSPSSVLNLEQAADLEELKQLLLSDTPLARSVAPRLRMLRLIASRHEVIYTHPKAHWYKMKGWREVLECGHEHHVYQVEDLTAKRRNCPTCAKAAQLQNADELIQVLQDSGRGESAEQEQNKAVASSSGDDLKVPPLSNERPETSPCSLTGKGTGLNNQLTGGSNPSTGTNLTPHKQPSQSVLRHKEKSA